MLHKCRFVSFLWIYRVLRDARINASLSVIPVLFNEFDDGFHQVILNEVKNLTILAHEILLPPRRDQDD